MAEGNRLAIYKRGRGFQLVTTKNKSKVAWAGLEPGTSGLRVRRADHSAKASKIKERLYWQG